MFTLNLTQLVVTVKNIKYLFITLILFSSSFVFALKEDIKKPVHINADSVEFNKSKGFAIYEGNVSITQGTLEIKAARIHIDAPKNKLTKIVATGSPVSFKQKMEDGRLAKGSAKQFTYLIESKRIVMNGNAKVSQNKDNFSSNHIEFSIRNGELKAGNKKDRGKSRVKAIFYPSN